MHGVIYVIPVLRNIGQGNPQPLSARDVLKAKAVVDRLIFYKIQYERSRVSQNSTDRRRKVTKIEGLVDTKGILIPRPYYPGDICNTQTVASTIHQARILFRSLPVYGDKCYDCKRERTLLKISWTRSFQTATVTTPITQTEAQYCREIRCLAWQVQNNTLATWNLSAAAHLIRILASLSYVCSANWCMHCWGHFYGRVSRQSPSLDVSILG